LFTPETMFSVQWPQVFADFESDEKEPVASVPENIGAGRAVGRLVDNLSPVYAVISLGEAQLADYLDEDKLDIVFPELSSDTVITGYLTEEEDAPLDQRYVAVRLDTNDPFFYSVRYQKVMLHGEDRSGLSVPASALVVVEDGKTGVYVSKRQVLDFKEITVLYRNEELAIVDGLKSTDKVASDPSGAKEGQKIY